MSHISVDHSTFRGFLLTFCYGFPDKIFTPQWTNVYSDSYSVQFSWNNTQAGLQLTKIGIFPTEAGIALQSMGHALALCTGPNSPNLTCPSYIMLPCKARPPTG